MCRRCTTPRPIARGSTRFSISRCFSTKPMRHGATRATALVLAMVAFQAGNAIAEPLATLTVRVEKVSDRGGNLRVALYDRASWPNDDAKPVIDGVVPAQKGETIVTLRDIPPGTYGLK